LDLEYQRADLKLIAVGQWLFADEAAAVDECAVAAGEITDGDGPLGDTQEAMLPADPIAVGSDMTFRSSAENVFTTREKQAFPLRLSLNHEQLDVHGNVALRQSPSVFIRLRGVDHSGRAHPSVVAAPCP